MCLLNIKIVTVGKEKNRITSAGFQHNKNNSNSLQTSNDIKQHYKNSDSECS